MNSDENARQSSASRRDFLKTSGTALAGTALLNEIAARSYAGEDNTIKIALVGCGGRGTGAAANALSTKGPTKLWAMADVFDNRLAVQPARRSRKQFAKQVDVPKERQFVGLDGYRKAIDALGPGRRRAAGHAAGLPADPRGIRRGQGLPRVHGEVVRRRRPGHSPRAQGGRGGRARRTSRSPAA